MRNFTKALAVAAAVAATMAVPAHADTPKMDTDKFVTMCDKDKDGMVSKQEMMKMVEDLYAKHDTKKMGKLDKKQVEQFLKDFTRMSGG